MSENQLYKLLKEQSDAKLIPSNLMWLVTRSSIFWMFPELNLGDQGGVNDLEDFYSATDIYEERITGLERGWWELPFSILCVCILFAIPQIIKVWRNIVSYIAGET